MGERDALVEIDGLPATLTKMVGDFFVLRDALVKIDGLPACGLHSRSSVERL